MMKRIIVTVTTILALSGLVLADSATVTQTGNNQTANVSQTNTGGLDNTATVTQYSDNSGPQDAQVVQNGVENVATVTQNQTGIGDTTLNTAYIEQVGTHNMGTQYQNAPGYNSGQSLYAYQNYFWNTVNQSILGGYTNSFRATQNGKFHDAQQTMNGAYIFGEIIQAGWDNHAVQDLTGMNHTNIDIRQDGEYNFASQTFIGGTWSIFQTGQIDQLGDNNDATQYSDGNGNEAIIYQDGDWNQAYQSMVGNGNYAYAGQFGDNNYASQTQTGDGNSSTVNQTGNGNSAIVVQSP